MNINDLLEELEKELEESSSMPLTGKKLVDKAYVLDIVKDMRENLPSEITEARAITADKQRIVSDAHREAEEIVTHAKERASVLVDQDEITQQAYQKADEILANAKSMAEEIRNGAQSYADEVLGDVEHYIQEYVSIVRANREELKR